MNIPLNISPLGYTLAPAGDLPAGYTRLAFLESTGTQFIDTDYGTHDSNAYELTYQTTETNTAATLYAMGFSAPLNRVWSYGEYGTGSTFFGYVWRGQYGTLINDPSGVVAKFQKRTIYLRLNEFAMDGEPGLDASQTATDSVPATAPAKTMTLFGTNYGSGQRVYAHKIWSFVYTNAVLDINTCFVPAVTPVGEAGMFDIITQTYYPPQGDGAFIAGIETLKQLQQLASNLPTVTGTPEIKLSLPGEWNGDASANAQLSIITGKGWSTTITYRDVETSTSSSFVLGNRGDGGSALVLWCRAVESDSGNYQDADGTRYYVETCHDIWHPQELSPDDLGYTAALTLEEYLTERGLTSIEYPEEELTA